MDRECSLEGRREGEGEGIWGQHRDNWYEQLRKREESGRWGGGSYIPEPSNMYHMWMFYLVLPFHLHSRQFSHHASNTQISRDIATKQPVGTVFAFGCLNRQESSFASNQLFKEWQEERNWRFAVESDHLTWKRQTERRSDWFFKMIQWYVYYRRKCIRWEYTRNEETVCLSYL